MPFLCMFCFSSEAFYHFSKNYFIKHLLLFTKPGHLCPRFTTPCSVLSPCFLSLCSSPCSSLCSFPMFFSYVLPYVLSPPLPYVLSPPLPSCSFSMLFLMFFPHLFLHVLSPMLFLMFFPPRANLTLYSSNHSRSRFLSTPWRFSSFFKSFFVYNLNLNLNLEITNPGQTGDKPSPNPNPTR